MERFQRFFLFVSNDSLTSSTPGGSGEAEVDRMTSDFGASISGVTR